MINFALNSTLKSVPSPDASNLNGNFEIINYFYIYVKLITILLYIFTWIDKHNFVFTMPSSSS